MTDVLSRSPDGLVEASVWLPRRPRSASRARAKLRRFLAEVDDGELFLEIGELLLTELVTNAVRHARTPSGRLVLARFELSFGLLRIEVQDASEELPTLRMTGVEELPTLRMTGVEAEAGRGLWLVDQLSAGWGCCARTAGIGKTVWCLVAPAEVRGARLAEEEMDQ